MSGRKLDLSVCKEEIKVMKYIGDVEELDITSAIGLADKGIDVFNASDDFFNDICQQYDNTDGKDIVLTDRRTDIFQNATFCQSGCEYAGMNYELMAANCICDSGKMQNDFNNSKSIEEENNGKETASFNSLTKSVIANLFDFNLDVFKCYNLVFDFKSIKNNIGFYCILIMFILQLICFFVYLGKKLKSLKYFMLIFINNNTRIIFSFPPPKNYIKNKLEDNKNRILKNNQKGKIKELILGDETTNISSSKRKIQFMNDNENIFSKKNAKNLNNKKLPLNIKDNKDQEKIIFSNNFTPILNIQTPILNLNQNKIVYKDQPNFDKMKKKNEIKLEKNNEDKIYYIKSKGKIKFKKNKKIKNKNDKEEKDKEINFMETKNEKFYKKKTKNEISLSKTDEDLQDMEYEEAILYDKRSFLRMYWAFLIDTQIILGTFCTDSYLNLFVIKLSFFIFNFQIMFFLNAFFYTDEYISDAYHNDGVLDFVSGLPKSIYSFIATLITTNLLRMLSNSKSELKKLIREKRKNKNYINLIDIKLKRLRIKLIIYFIFVFLLGLLFFYYVTSFCAVYRYSQKYWFLGCLQSFGIDSFVAISICIILALFRYIAIKKHIKCFYYTTNLISTFL